MWLLFQGDDYYPEPFGQNLAAVCDTFPEALVAADWLVDDGGAWQAVFEVEAPAVATERWTRRIGGPYPPSAWEHERPVFIEGSRFVDWEKVP